VNNYAM